MNANYVIGNTAYALHNRLNTSLRGVPLYDHLFDMIGDDEGIFAMQKPACPVARRGAWSFHASLPSDLIRATGECSLITTRQSYTYSLMRVTPFQSASAIVSVGHQRPGFKPVDRKTSRPRRGKSKLHNDSVLVICVWNFGIV
jgi:hypothetical protein